VRLKYKKKYKITNTSQTIIPDIELNAAIFRFVIIQTEPQTIRVKIKKRRSPSGIISIFSSFLKTFMKGGKGVKLRRKDRIYLISYFSTSSTSSSFSLFSFSLSLLI